MTCCVFSAHIGQSSLSLPGKNLVCEIAEHIGVLCRRDGRCHVSATVTRRDSSPHRRIDRPGYVPVDFKTKFVAVKRMHKIRNLKIALRAAHVNPLLEGGEKRTVKTRRNIAVKNQLGGKFRRRGRTRVESWTATGLSRRRRAAISNSVAHSENRMQYQPRSPRQPAGSSAAIHADVVAEEIFAAGKTECET